MQHRDRDTFKPFVVGISALSLAWAIVFALDLLPILRGGYDWAWHYKPVLERYRITPLILSLLCYAPVALWLRKRGSAGIFIAWTFLGSLALTLAAVHLRGDVLYRLYSLTASGRASGWHMAATQIQNLQGALTGWPQFMIESRAFSSHVDHSPPGMVLVYYGAARLLDEAPRIAGWMAAPLQWMLCQYLAGYSDGQYASAWLGIITPVWAALTVLPMYYLGRRVFDESVARWSTLWWPLVPSLLVFAPLPYTAYALLALLVTALLWEGLSSDHLAWTAAAGALLSVLTFLKDRKSVV